MTIKTVEWCSFCRLPCIGATDRTVVLCLASSDLVAPIACPSPATEEYTYSFIEATLCQGYTLDKANCGVAQWHYTFQYDTAELANGVTALTTSDITAAFCKDCLTSWVEQIVGDEVHVITDAETGDQTLITQHGCQYDIGGPADPVCVTDSQSIDFSIDGGGCVTGDVIISPDAANALSLHANGLYATAGGGGSGWALLGNAGTVDGTNFLGTTDNIAFTIRQNNEQVLRVISGGATKKQNIILGPNTNIITTSVNSLIGGGAANTIQNGYFTTVGAGDLNFISDANNVCWGTAHHGSSTVAGGQFHFIDFSLDKYWKGTHSGFNDCAYRGWATVGGGHSNVIEGGIGGTISGGEQNQIYFTIFTPGQFITIDPGYGDVISGGVINQIVYDDQQVSQSNLPATLCYNYIGGGYHHSINTSIFGTICGGMDNEMEYSGSTPFWMLGNFIGGGICQRTLYASRSLVVGGAGNVITGTDSGSILGGYINTILATLNPAVQPYDVTAAPTFANLLGPQKDPHNSAGVGDVILGGQVNTITDGRCSSILGGAFLQIGADSVGYQSPATRDFTNLNGAYRLINASAGSGGYPGRDDIFPQVDVSAFSSIAYFGDVDIWVANTNSSATKVKFFEPNSDLDFSSTNYSSFKAQAQGANIDYIWPAAAGTAGQQLTIDTVVGTVVTLKWA